MKALAFVLFVFSAHAAEEWPGRNFVEVRAFAWPHTLMAEHVIDRNGAMMAGGLNPEGTLLSESQVKRLLGAINVRHAKRVQFSCHNPHNVFVFYDVARKPVAFVEVCFACQSAQLNPERDADFVDITAFARIFGKLSLPLGEYADFASYQRHFAELIDVPSK